MKRQIIFLLMLVGFINNINAQWQKTNGTNGYIIRSLAAKGSNIFAGAYGGIVFFSSDSGQNWEAVNTNLSCVWVNALAIKGNYTFAGTDKGVYVTSNNGLFWSSLNTGMPTNDFLNIMSFAINDSCLFAGTNVGVYKSTNNGQIWSYSDLQDGAFLTLHGNNIFAAKICNVSFSSDNGRTWTFVNNGVPFTTIYCMTTNDSNVFAGSDSGVLLTTNKGQLWTNVSNGLTDTSVFALAVSRKYIFAGTDQGVFLSLNNGNYWEDISENLLNEGPTNIEIYALTINEDYVFVGSANGVWKRPLADFESIEQGRGSASISAFPNPTTSNIKIKSTGKLIRYFLFDALGNMVLQSNFENGSDAQINMLSLGAGVYFLKAYDDNNYILNKKIIKL